MADSKSDSIIDGHFATNPTEIPIESPQRETLEQCLDNGLWQYACRVYSQAGVEAALLALQDDCGADINMILQALWLASEGREWSKACIPDDYAQWMTEQVQPLRQMRRSIKMDWVENKGTQYEDFRQQVKKLELKAEQYALAMLFVQANGCEDGTVKNTEVALLNNLDVLAQETDIVLGSFQKLIAPLFTLKP